MKQAWSIVTLFCAIAVLLSVPGCTKDSPDPVVIGVLLFGDSRQPQVDGFIDEMKGLGYGSAKPARYLILNAKNDRKKLPELVKELMADKVDLLVAAGGLEADTIKRLTHQSGVPVVVLYVNAIVERGLVKTRNESGWSVTGVDNLNAELSSKRVELIKDLFPDVRRILILYYRKIAPSRIGVEQAQAVAEKLAIEIDARQVSSRDDIRSTMESLEPGDVDVMLTVPTAPIDNALGEIILPQASRLGLPLFTHSRPLAKLGAFASYGADFYDLGQQAARLAHKILTGVQANKIPFEIPKKFTYTINRDVQNKLGIELTEIAHNQVNDYVTIGK